ncbi:MAG: DNA-binding Lrp family transcriptional regulator, partial [Rhodococcus sp. (in: high G+C Gram-positive bacteria)]
MINAIVMIDAEAHAIPETAQAVADVEGVTEVYSCAGDVDLIAMVKVRDHQSIADV